VSAFPANGSRAGGLPASGVDAIAFDSAAATRWTDSPRPDDLNGLDGVLCEALGAARLTDFLLAFLPDLLAAALRVFEGRVFADLVDWARGALPEDALGDFLRVFLDIRLPFVAFGGSIMGVLRVLSRRASIEPAAGQV
jgi:hypothetical protein